MHKLADKTVLRSCLRKDQTSIQKCVLLYSNQYLPYTCMYPDCYKCISWAIELINQSVV